MGPTDISLELPGRMRVSCGILGKPSVLLHSVGVSITKLQGFHTNPGFFYISYEPNEILVRRKVAVMKSTGKYVVCDRGNERSRMQIFTRHGHFVRKIAIRYIDIVAGLAITRDGHIVAVDSVTPTIFVILEHGELLRWFDCAGEMVQTLDTLVILKL